MNPRTLSIPEIGSISAAVICSEYGNFSNFDSPTKMLSFACLEPGYYQSGLSVHKGPMVKRGSSNLRYTLMSLSIPLIQCNIDYNPNKLR